MKSNSKEDGKTADGKSNESAAALLIAIGLGWYFFGGGEELVVSHEMDKIHQQVAFDVIQQYEIAKRSGTPVDAHVHAGIVAAAYLQANDEPNYQKWKAIERQDAVRAGMPGR